MVTQKQCDPLDHNHLLRRSDVISFDSTQKVNVAVWKRAFLRVEPVFVDIKEVTQQSQLQQRLDISLDLQ